jgi:hypothetical protein
MMNPPLQHVARAALVCAVGAIAACTAPILRQHPTPAPESLLQAMDARAILDSVGSQLVIVHGIITTSAVFDSIPPDEVISFELVAGTGGPAGELQKVGLVMRCTQVDTSVTSRGRTVIRRFARCPWSAFPKAER